MDDVEARLGVPIARIEEFCRRWNIVRFEVFGSVLRDDFDSASDVDVLVTYAPGGTRTLSSHLDQEEELAALFRRRVDLVERNLVETNPNWVRRKAILRSAHLVYAAA
jgi:predicted nucleotidyltransferase